jgi:hypothetical protein
MKQSLRITGMVLVVLAIIMTPPTAYTQEILEDVVLITREKEIVAFSSSGNQWVLVSLRAQEHIVESRSDGRVAVVVTNQRALAFSSLTNKWNEMRLEVGEKMLDLEAKGLVVSVDTSFRALGFGARQGAWKEHRYRAR